MDPMLEQEFKNELMSTVKEFYERRLLVYPIKNNLSLNGAYACGGVQIPEAHKTEGVPADIIIYVYGNNYSDEYWVARAAACILEGYPYNNVIAGRIEINSGQYTSSLSYEDKMQTVIHEMFHVLGFSNSLFHYFVKEDGNPYSTEELTLFTDIRGKPAVLLTTPTVKTLAQKAFGCSDLEGVELEDAGGVGTVGSHWEKRVMFNDFMIGDIGPTDIIYSDISFGILQDSGWYTVNWDYTQSIVYGKGKGCQFLDEKCVYDGVAQFDEFCTDSSSESKCDYLRLNKGYCTKFNLKNDVLSSFNYFNDPKIGNIDQLIDYCPIVKSFDYGNCRGVGSEPTLLDKGSGETVGINSRCIEHTLLDSSYSYTSQYRQSRPGCFQVSCSRSLYSIIIDGDSYPCAPGKSIQIRNYNGYIDCPRYEEVCEIPPCLLGCRGVGICRNGACICDKGYGGNDCSIECDSTCYNCNGPASNDCLSCDIGYSLRYGRCVLNPVGNCTSLCKKCSEEKNCESCVENAEIRNEKCECMEGFSYINDQCLDSNIQCRRLCEVCNNLGVCSACKKNAHLKEDGVCECDNNYRDESNKCVYLVKIADLAGDEGEGSSSQYSPIYCMGTISGIFCLIFMLYLMLSCQKKLQESKLRVHDISPTPIKSLNVESPRTGSPVIEEEHSNTSFSDNWKLICFPLSLFSSDGLLEQIAFSATMYSVFVFELFLMGVFYWCLEDKIILEGSEEDDEIAGDYRTDDLIYLLICIGCAIPLDLLYKVLLSRRDVNKDLIALILGFIIAAGSVIGTISINVQISDSKAELWTLNFIIMCIVEVILTQSLTALMLSGSSHTHHRIPHL
jgi:leishmanolysin